MDILQIIQKQFPFFELDLANQIAEVGEVKQIKSGEVIMRTGQNIKSTMLV
ncbi:MAG: hypothetical protein RIR64_1969, partial [Bacteroidota bacterium]